MPDMGLFVYWVIIILMMTGLYVVIAKSNLIKKVIGLNVFQVSVIMFYVSLGKVSGGTAPIKVADPDQLYSNPVPHVLMLTAIVVGVATTALALALVVRVNESFGTIEDFELITIENNEEINAAMSPTRDDAPAASPVAGDAATSQEEPA